MCLPHSFDQYMDFERRSRESDEKAISEARLLRGLTVEFQGRVLGVNNYNTKVIYTPKDEFVGSSSPKYELGQQSDLEIFLTRADSFSSHLKEQVLKKLKFKGNSLAKRGDRISAGIFLGEKVKLSCLFTEDDYLNSKDLVFSEDWGIGNDSRMISSKYVWTLREFKEEEEAVYIKILDGQRYVLRTDFSANYDSKIHVLR